MSGRRQGPVIGPVVQGAPQALWGQAPASTVMPMPPVVRTVHGTGYTGPVMPAPSGFQQMMVAGAGTPYPAAATAPSSGAVPKMYVVSGSGQKLVLNPEAQNVDAFGRRDAHANIFDTAKKTLKKIKQGQKSSQATASLPQIPRDEGDKTDTKSLR